MIEEGECYRENSIGIVLLRDRVGACDHHRNKSDDGKEDHEEDVHTIKIHEIRSGDRTEGKDGKRQNRRGEKIHGIQISGGREGSIPEIGKGTEDHHNPADGEHNGPERNRASDSEEWIGQIHEKAGEHQHGKGEADRVNCCSDSTEMVHSENAQEKEARYEGEEKKAKDLPKERNRETECVHSNRA